MAPISRVITVLPDSDIVVIKKFMIHLAVFLKRYSSERSKEQIHTLYKGRAVVRYAN
jgi:hypothetical protein